jgi:hypothetical protein
MTLQSSIGRVRRKLQWQTASISSGSQWESAQSDAAWLDTTVPVQRVISMPNANTPWRWITLSGNGMYERDFRTVPCGASNSPTLEVSLSGVDKNAEGLPVFTITDPNPPAVVDGYNVYIASDREGPWIQVGFNQTDALPGTPGIQFVPINLFEPFAYYEITAFNEYCFVESPR